MNNYVEGLPSGLDIQSIAPHTRHDWARNETVYNGDRSRFVVAFNVFEHSMMNDTGLFAWGEIDDGKPINISHIQNQFAHCWERPFASWVTQTTFVVKISTKRPIYPLLAVDFKHGFQIVPNTNELSSRPSNVVASDLASGRWQSRDDILVALN